MTAFDNFPWPVPAGAASEPRWTGNSFSLGETDVRVLSYGVETSHWSESLTSLHETEAGRDHPMDLASRRLAVDSMRRLPDSPGTIIMDVGCSSGFILEDLRRNLPQAGLIGADYLLGPLEGLARRMPSIPILQFDLRACPLPDACVDGITCLHVLEHIDDHTAALGHIHRVLKPGGIAHIEVPAGPGLYDLYDEVLMHHRRYRLAELEGMATAAGFKIVRASHLGFVLYPAFWLVKKRNRRKYSLPPEAKVRIMAAQLRATKANPILGPLMRFEIALGRYVSFPWGIRCLMVLRKSGQTL